MKPLHIILLKTSAIVKCFDGQTKFMYFLLEGDALLEKYNLIGNNVNADIKKKNDSCPLVTKL